MRLSCCQPASRKTASMLVFWTRDNTRAVAARMNDARQLAPRWSRVGGQNGFSISLMLESYTRPDRANVIDHVLPRWERYSRAHRRTISVRSALTFLRLRVARSAASAVIWASMLRAFNAA